MSTPLQNALSVAEFDAESMAVAWNNFVIAEPNANPFQLAQWRDILHEAFAVEPLYRMVLNREGQIFGVVPAYFSAGLVVPRQITTMEGGILSASDNAAEMLAEDLYCNGRSNDARHVIFKGGETGRRLGGFTSRRVFPSIDLTNGIAVVRGRLSKKMRYQIKRSEEIGLEIVHHHQIPSEFYSVFARSQRNLGTPVVPRSLFEAVNHFLASNVHFTGLFSGRRLVSGLIGLRFRTGYYSLYAATESDFQRQYANYLLYLKVMEWAVEEGFEEFNMGRSSIASGAYRYKSKWRPTDTEVEYRCLPIAQTANGNRTDLLDRDGSGLATRAWKKLPLPLANLIGPVLRRQLPFG